MGNSWWPRHDADEIDAVADVLRSGLTNYWQGPHGQAFEREFAAYTGAAYCLTVSNGTTALECALHALDIPRGVEVIVPCRTFMATASAVVNNGQQVVLADIDAETLNVTVETLEARRTPMTWAVIVVHYAGLMCDMPAIMAWAKEHRIRVIEDCAHAHGAVGAGTHGDVGCYSFCVGKIMSTGGEGGCVVTDDEGLARRMAAYRDHGRYQMVGSRDMTRFEYSVEEFGSNLRMTEVQSVIARRQLLKLDGWVRRRREIAFRYDMALGWASYKPRHVYYMYTGFVGDRDEKLAALNAMGVPARLNGCPNLGREPVFRGTAASCPVADAVGMLTLGLPVYPTMTDAEVDEIARKARTVLG